MKKIIFWVLIILGVLLLSVFAIGLLTVNTAKKPAVYLYPQEDMQVSVQVEINGRMTTNIPEYNDGWNVFATKEGLINNEYDYLFYEANLRKIVLPQEGWVVAYEDLENWFDHNLVSLGLNEREVFQFKEYWLPELNKYNYYEIKLLSNDFLEKNMKLIVTPEPDTLIRLNFYFKGHDKFLVLDTPTIITPKREGFVVVEWGGILS